MERIKEVCDMHNVVTSFLDSMKGFLNAGTAFIYPEICQICAAERATPDQCFICTSCRGRVQFIEPPFCSRCGLPFQGAITTSFECSNCREEEWDFETARSAVVARDPILEVIHRYKYRHATWFEPFLAELLIVQARAEILATEYDWIVPVPLHPAKQREREFNQAEHLARRLSRATQIPVDTRLIRRVVATRTQTLLHREERLANVRRAFATKKGLRLNGERLLLVDDVFTTGATTGACAKVLREAGAGEVCVWTVARGV
jgi:ComF family protein